MDQHLDWKLPPTQIGDQAMFRQTVESQGVLAWVIKVDQRSVWLFIPGRGIIQGVRHEDDPQLVGRPHIAADYGIYRVCGLTVAVEELERRIEALEAKAGVGTPPEVKPVAKTLTTVGKK